MHEDAKKLLEELQNNPEADYLIVRISKGGWTPAWKISSIPLALGILHYVMATLTTEMTKILEKRDADRTDSKSS